MDNIILEIKNLKKTYNKIKAVDDISLSVKKGEIVGLLGPNGAGKTTLINMILTVLEPTGGLIWISGKNARENRETLKDINFTAVSTQIPGNLTIKENLIIFGMIYGIENLKEKINQVAEELDLDKLLNTKVGFLSSGEQTRVSLAKALINSPKLLLLDEPTASLDPHISAIIRLKIKEYAEKNDAAVLWTSHNMYEIEGVCDRILFISHGKIILEGNPRELPQQYKKKNMEELFVAIAKEPLSFNCK
ncbi:MAG: ABC transporter ATP-binding protein [Patescibacteria group bacterium]